jgi:hypothetical protein
MENEVYQDEYEISLKELIEVIWKHKYLIILITVLGAVLGFAGGTIFNSRNSEVGTIVTMQWKGVSAGEYPDGTRFEYSEAIEPYVISLAVDELGMDLVTNNVRNQFSISPIVPSSVLTMVQQSIEQGDPITYYATDYKLMLNNANLGISVEEARDLLNEIVNQFRIDFERQYINQVSVYDFTNQDISDYDYLDSYDILNTQIELIDSAMNERSDVSFTSPTLGIGFDDIAVRANLVSRIELNQIYSRTNSFLLTKDEDFLLINYTFKIESLNRELTTLNTQESEIQTMLDNYTGSTQTIIIPGMSDTDSLEIDTYYNTLISKQIELQQQISEKEEDVTYYQLLIDRLNGEDPDFTVTPTKQAEEAVRVENYIEVADEKLGLVVNDANILLSEYNEYLTSNIIKPLMAPEYQPTVNVLLYAGIGLLLGGMLSTGFVLGKHFWNAE